MKLCPRILGLALLGCAAPLVGQPTSTQQYEAVGPADEIDRTTEATDVAFKQDDYERMTVPVRVGGTGPYRFLIDTGADRTAISNSLARRLRLTQRGGTTLHSVTGASSVGTANVPVLDLTAKQVMNVDAALLEASNMGADGILGLDSLRSQRILFDFKSQTLTIVPSKVKVREDRGTIVVTGRLRNGRLVLADAIAENMRVTLVVDTGAQVSIGNQALRRKLTRARKVRQSGTVELVSVTGDKILGEYLLVRELEVGGVTLRDLPVVFADSHAFRRLGLDEKPALLLGMNALRSFEKVSIDFARRKLRVVLPQESSLARAVLASR